MTHAQAIRLAQNHEHTLNILSKIVLAGLQVLLSSAVAAELSWEYGRVSRHVFLVISPCFGVRISPYWYRAYPDPVCGSIYDSSTYAFMEVTKGLLSMKIWFAKPKELK